VVARWAAVATGVALLVYGVPKIPSEYYSERARMAIRDGRFAEGLAFAEAGLKSEARNPDLHHYAGEARRMLAVEAPQRLESLAPEAVASFEEGLRLFPDDIRSVLKLARLYDQMEAFDRASELLERAQGMDPNLTSVYAFTALHHHQQGDFDEAESNYEAALHLDPQNEIAKAGMREIGAMRAALRERVSKLRLDGSSEDGSPSAPAAAEDDSLDFTGKTAAERMKEALEQEEEE
jgi:tetratricopeptide (TPR) repeat protein